MRRICVFAGSSTGNDPAWADAARALGRAMAARGIGLVYGGGGIGLMGVVADAALAGGVPVVGIIPRALATKEIAHHGVTELRVVPSMHERKAEMATLADGFIALPGGLGTFEELFEVLTWAQLGLHAKPIGLLDAAGYYAPLAALIAHAVGAGFVRPEHASLLVRAATADALLDAMAAYHPSAPREKWIDLDET